MYSLQITPVAETDIVKASLWYRFQRVGLEREFFICVEAAINLIKRNPLLFAELNKKGVRKINIQKFPYGIYFYIEKEEIIILSVLHLRDNPVKWKIRK